MQMPKRMFEWLKQHAELKNGTYLCKTTREPIQSSIVGRSIWELGMTGGSGEVHRILHVACLKCEPHAEPPQYGTPIGENDLVESGIGQKAV